MTRRSTFNSMVPVLVMTGASLSLAFPAHDGQTIGNGACDAGNACGRHLHNNSSALLDARKREAQSADRAYNMENLGERFYINNHISLNEQTSSLFCRSGRRGVTFSKDRQRQGGASGCWPALSLPGQATFPAVYLNDEIGAKNTDQPNEGAV